MRKARYGWLVSIPFFAVHVAAVLGVGLVGFSWQGVVVALVLYYVRMWGVTAGYHRYFSHRTYRTGRAFQLFLALLAQTSMQKGALWWAAHHRGHHKYADTPEDVHSFRTYGFWYSHVGWILDRETEATEWDRIGDLKRYPELVWLNKWHLVPGITYAVATYLVGGWTGFVWGFLVATTMLWHGTFFINSLAHTFGRRRYPTTDDGKNSFLLAVLTLGEGWHNNHHYYPRSVRQGFFWWELDVSYYVLRALSWTGLVWDLHVPSERVKAGKLSPTIVAAAKRKRAESAFAPSGATSPVVSTVSTVTEALASAAASVASVAAASRTSTADAE